MMFSPLLLDIPASFETSRLVARIPTAGDGLIFYSALVESIANLREYIGALAWVAAEPTIESSETFCRNAFANFHARKDFPYLLLEKTSGRMVGVCGMHRPDWSTPKVELGYWCRSTAQGHGYATEAVRQLAELAFHQLDAKRVELLIDEQNLASRKVAERCNFELEGVLRCNSRAPDGSLRNACIYARVRHSA